MLASFLVRFSILICALAAFTPAVQAFDWSVHGFYAGGSLGSWKSSDYQGSKSTHGGFVGAIGKINEKFHYHKEIGFTLYDAKCEGHYRKEWHYVEKPTIIIGPFQVFAGLGIHYNSLQEGDLAKTGPFWALGTNLMITERFALGFQLENNLVQKDFPFGDVKSKVKNMAFRGLYFF